MIVVWYKTKIIILNKKRNKIKKLITKIKKSTSKIKNVYRNILLFFHFHPNYHIFLYKIHESLRK